MGRRKLTEEEKAQRKAEKKPSVSKKKTRADAKEVKSNNKDLQEKRGRPTKYNQQVQLKAEEYLKAGWKNQDYSPFPSHIGLSFYLDVNTSTLYEWAKHHEIFSKTLAKINEKQQIISWHMGLTNQYNATIVKLLLSTHGIHERSDKDVARDVVDQMKTEFHIHPVKKS